MGDQRDRKRRWNKADSDNSGRLRACGSLRGTAPLGGGQFGLLFHWLDRRIESPYACFSRSSPEAPYFKP